MTWKIELVPLLMNALLTAFYVWKGDEPYKVFYWLGATVLTFGLYNMKG